MVRFYMDENVDGPITAGLRQRGIDVITVQEDGRTGLNPDALVLDRATELRRVLITQDIDLLVEGQKRQKGGTFFAGVIYAPKERSTWGEYIEQLELIALLEEPAKYHNYVEYLPLW